MHNYYHIESITDLDKTRDAARDRAVSRGIFYGCLHEDSMIHMHKRDESCIRYDHERYHKGGEVVIYTPDGLGGFKVVDRTA